MKVGDVVVHRRERNGLHCGSGIYTHAIVASMEPFVLVSEEGDMKWTCTIEPDDVVALCQAHPKIVEVAIKRFKANY